MERMVKVNIRNSILYAVPFLFVCGIAYGNYGSSDPKFVKDAIDTVSSRMSYNLGVSDCKASQKEVNEWKMICTPINGATALDFSVMPAGKAPYEVPTSFYLIADNDAAKKSAGEDLLSYMMINTSSNVTL